MSISPAAQAVLDAYSAAADFTFHESLDFWGAKAGIAAALRAVADLEDVKPKPLGLCDERYGDPIRTKRISQRDFMYELAKERKKAQVAAQRQILAIAAELEGSNDPA